MKKLTFLSLFLLAAAAHATVTAYSPPVGGVTTSAAASTDTLVSVTLAQPAAWIGTVATVSGSDITMSGTPGWSANAFIGTPNYVRVLSGAQAGHYFSIVANSTDTTTVDSAGLNLGTIVAGDTVEIAPYWTLGTLFPASQAGAAFTVTTSTLAKKTQLLFYDATATGINRSPSATYYFFNNAWRKVGQPTTVSYDGTIVFPDTYLLQRNVTSSTSVVYMGRVQPGALGTILTATASVQNDNFVALSFPVDVTLNGSGLSISGFTASTSTISLKDQLLWFDPAGTGTNRSPTFTYYYFNGAWRRKGASATIDFGSTTLSAGSGFIIRKAANGTTAQWVFSTGI